MATYEIFSKRQKRLRGELPDTYQYKTLPGPLRVQVVYILRDVCVEDCGSDYELLKEWFKQIHGFLARKYGVFRLHDSGNTKQKTVELFIRDADVEQVLDVIEISLRVAYSHDSTPGKVRSLNRLVDELNGYFREHGVGYRFESGLMVRVDSDFLHEEAIRPALHLLRASHFAGAETEFHQAHEHYRHRRFQESINESLKALESTLKVICTRKQWSFGKRDTASKLIDIVFERGLIPEYLESQLDGLRNILKCGVPTIRNRDGGYGTGAKPRQVPSHLAAYALHLTASAIVFLAEAAGDLE